MSLFRDYRRIERYVLFAILAEFCVQLVNATFMNLQTLYMKAEGYHDAEIADFISWRFAGVLVFAFPLGMFIRGKKVRPLFRISSAGVPLFALCILWCVHFHHDNLLIVSQWMWGTCFTFIQIPMIPFILRNCSPENRTAAISLSYSTWSLAGISSAVFVAVTNHINPVLFSERNLMAAISVAAFAGVYFVSRVKTEKEPGVEDKPVSFAAQHDWKLIFSALFPALIIATGAGLTIPFINLFFSRVHHMETDVISAWNFCAALLVAIAALTVPKIKKTIGYRVAVPTTQTFAVVALVLMATTELYNHLAIAGVIAVACYIIRQPLMNVAGPMTTEISMKYVGKKNREITSALAAAIWSGSWFISTRFIFASLRNIGWPYVDIFLITAAFYMCGIILYVLLIRSYNRREKAGLITEE
ncbi:MAG TPA: MFS transporter [Bacteroidia bacterium]|nr:MFS transporter [Bacteroidia bacterium]